MRLRTQTDKNIFLSFNTYILLEEEKHNGERRKREESEKETEERKEITHGTLTVFDRVIGKFEVTSTSKARIKKNSKSE